MHAADKNYYFIILIDTFEIVLKCIELSVALIFLVALLCLNVQHNIWYFICGILGEIKSYRTKSQFPQLKLLIIFVNL